MGALQRKKMAVPPRPLLNDLYHPGSLVDLHNCPPPLSHHQYYGAHYHLGRTLDRVTAYDRVSHLHGETAHTGEPGHDLALNYHPRSWRNPPVDLSDLRSAASYQAANSTGSHILDTFSRSRNLQNDLLHHKSLGFDYHVLPVAKYCAEAEASHSAPLPHLSGQA